MYTIEQNGNVFELWHVFLDRYDGEQSRTLVSTHKSEGEAEQEAARLAEINRKNEKDKMIRWWNASPPRIHVVLDCGKHRRMHRSEG